jgi:hypothetical protein
VDIFDYERPVGIQIFGGDEETMEMSFTQFDAVQPICWISILDVLFKKSSLQRRWCDFERCRFDDSFDESGY